MVSKTYCKALIASYDHFKKVFNDISENEDQEAKTRLEATSILKKLSSFDMVFMAIVWDTILERIDAVNKSIQGVNTNLGSAVGLYGSLIEYFQEMRNNRFEEFFKKVTDLEYQCVDSEDETRTRTRKRKFQFGENRYETTFNFKEKLQYDSYNIILEKLIVEMKRRKDAYEEVHNLFNFLIDLKNTDAENLREGAAKLVHFYDKDLDDGLIEESVHFKKYVSSLTANECVLTNNPSAILKLISKNDLICTFPNMYIALLIYSAIPVSNATGERSFSVLKRIKNYLRSVLGQQKLQDLAILAIESDIIQAKSILIKLLTNSPKRN